MQGAVAGRLFRKYNAKPTQGREAIFKGTNKWAKKIKISRRRLRCKLKL
jgi:hypothetical protein